MPVTKQISGDPTIVIKWCLENFSLNNCSTGTSLFSPEFETKKLGEARFHFELFPRGNINADYIACYLWKEISDTTDEVYLFNCTLSLLADKKSFFEKSCIITVKDSSVWRCEEFIKKDTIKREHLPRDTFTVQCKIFPDHSQTAQSSYRHLEVLSRDMISLFETQKFYDLILQVGDTQFKVHRSVLWARWPSLLKSLGIINVESVPNAIAVPGVSANSMKALLMYVYSGELDEANVSLELFKAAVLHQFDTLRKHLSSFPNEYIGRTVMNIEHNTVIWQLDDVISLERRPLSFIRILPIIELYISEVIIRFSITKDSDGDDAIGVYFRFSDLRLEMPIFLNCKILLSAGNGQTLAYCEKEHLFKEEDDWHFPAFVKKCQIIGKGPFLSVELTMCDGPKVTRIGATNTEFFTEFTPILDLQKLSTDLYTLLVEDAPNEASKCDMTFISKDGVSVLVHRAIIWARWPEVRERIAQGHEEGLLIVNVNETCLLTIVEYIYTGYIENGVEYERAQELIKVAKEVGIPKLLEEICEFNISNQSRL